MLMGKAIRHQRARLFAVLGFLLCLTPAAPALSAGIENSGFEEPVGAGGEVPGWTLSAVEVATITDGDDGTDYSVYADYGISVPPLNDNQSLLLGLPDVANGRQQPGFNRATTSIFSTSSNSITLSIRAFSFEARGNDRLQFAILDPSGQTDLSTVSWQFTASDELPGTRPLESVTSLCGSGAQCTLVIDIGKNNSPLFDSGIYEVEISGLPAETPLQLDVAVVTDANSSKATWMYVDDVLAPPPEAVIRVNPGDTPDLPALEGDFVVADCMQSVGVGLSCEWTASGGGWASPRAASGDIAFFWFPDNDPVNLELTVTAADGQSSTTSRPIYLVNAEPAVNAINVEILSGDLNAETICRFADAGIGQYDDDGLIPGTEELHTLLSGTPLAAEQESEASFSSGFFRIYASDGTCIVSDGTDTGADIVSVREVDPTTLAARLGDEDRAGGVGGNDTIERAHSLTIDWTYLGAISDPQDIDVFRVVAADGNSLPPGTELVISLSGQPADYDLLVLSDGGSTEASPFFNAPFFNAPFFNAPFFNAPFFNAPFFNAQFNSVPFFNAPFFNAPFFNAPFFNAPVKKSPFFNAGDPSQTFNRAFSDLPLSEVGLAAPDGGNVSGSDISVTEVGSLSLQSLQSTPGISLKGLSAEPGLNSEKVLVKVAPGETEIYVAVVGNDLAFSSNQPYALTLEASTPPSQKALLAGTGFCEAEMDSAGSPVYASSWNAPATGNPAAGSVLILTQRERFEIEQAQNAAEAVATGIFESTNLYWVDFWAKVSEYASAVGGTVVSVDGALFQAADNDPCSVQTRNELVQAIRDTYIVDPVGQSWRNGGLSSVVIIGGQNIIPPLAVPDETIVGNEKDFTTDLWVRPGTPLAVATAEGYNLTDAFYTDLIATPFRGRALYLEDRPVARLVEHPEEIKGDIDAFFAIQAGTAPNTGRLAYGYDFFCDGTADVAGLLGADITDVGPPCSGSAPWTASDLERDWLNGGASMCTESAATLPLEIANVNAHMTTYGALSARGFIEGLATGNYDDVLPTVAAQSCLNGTLTISIGCHSGLNIPDAWSIGTELGLPFDAARDWVELLGFMVAPRGYGLGDNTVSNRGTEGLMSLLVDELNFGRTLGQAFVNAKRRYVMSLRELDVHDEDSLINLTLFAPPQLTFPNRAVTELGAAFSPASSNASATSAGTLSLTVVENNADGSEDYLVGSSTSPGTYDLIRYDDLNFRGSWFEIFPGDAQATYGRSLQPVTLPFQNRDIANAPDQTRIHGVALVARTPVSPCPIDNRDSCNIAARYNDLGGPDLDGRFEFNPVLPLPQHDWVVYEDDLSLDSGLEPLSCVEALVPTQLGIASTLDTGESISQSLIIGAGQFRCESTASVDQVLGQQRLYSSLSLAALHPVGESTSEARGRDTDFDPPQVQIQTVISDPETGTVTASVRATDSLTGGSGIREIIALVYWDEAENASGTGVVESYSVTPSDSQAAEPFAHTFVLENARDQRLAFQYVDGAGNLTVKSQKGTLIQAVDVEILDTDISIDGQSTLSILIGDYCALQGAVVSYSIDNALIGSFAVDNPPPGVTVTVDQNPDCNAILTVEGLEFPFTEYGQSAELTIEVRAPGAVGSDTEQVFAPPVLEIDLPVLPSGTVGIAYPDQTFTGSGGVGDYTFAITSGSLPNDLNLTQGDGDDFAVISGALFEFAQSPYEFTLSLTDAGGVSTSVDLTLEVYPAPIVISTSSVPSGEVGIAYQATLSAVGGSGNATWQLDAGSSLPAGLTLTTVDSTTGQISGTPLAFTEGSESLTITLVDPDTNVVDMSVTLSLEIVPAILSIPATSLPDGTVDEGYPTQDLIVTGGSGAGTWSLSSGGLPPGINLSGSGEISGTPTSFVGSPFSFTAAYTDADQRVAPGDIALSITIDPAPLVIETTVLPEGTKYEDYSESLQAAGGYGGYQWVLSSGRLPRGLSLGNDGTISGTAERRETRTFTVIVSDGSSQISQAYTIKINNRSCDDGDSNHDHPRDCNDG